MASPFKGILKHLMPKFGGPVTVFRNHGTPQQAQRVIAKAMKNTKEKHGGAHVFQFEHREDIVEGDIIQQVGATDMWIVTDTEDFIAGGDLIYFEAVVEKASRSGAARSKQATGHTVNIGSVTGGVQVGTTNSSQNISVTNNPGLSEAFTQLRRFIADSDLDELDKGEVSHELARVEELAKKNDEPKVKAKLFERLDVIEKMVSVSEKLAKIAGPALGVIAAHLLK